MSQIRFFQRGARKSFMCWNSKRNKSSASGRRLMKTHPIFIDEATYPLKNPPEDKPPDWIPKTESFKQQSALYEGSGHHADGRLPFPRHHGTWRFPPVQRIQDGFSRETVKARDCQIARTLCCRQSAAKNLFPHATPQDHGRILRKWLPPSVQPPVLSWTMWDDQVSSNL